MTPEEWRELAAIVRKNFPRPQASDSLAVYLKRTAMNEIANSFIELAEKEEGRTGDLGR